MKHIKLFENFTNNKLLCYHATGLKGGGDWKNILKGEFKIGSGANFGPGLYTFYDLDDLKKDNTWNRSPVIIEFEVIDTSGFYVEVPEIATKMFGEYNIGKQVESIMGRDWVENNGEALSKILDNPSSAINLINLTRFNRQDALEEKMNKWIYGRELKGSIFLNIPDGVYCVIHDPSIANPVRYSLDMGKSWNLK